MNVVHLNKFRLFKFIKLLYERSSFK